MSDKIFLMADNSFDLEIHQGAVSSLRFLEDLYDTEYILPNRKFGHLHISYRKNDGPWRELKTKDLVDQTSADITHNPADSRVRVVLKVQEEHDSLFDIILVYKLKAGALYYDIILQNTDDNHIEIGDLALPWPMNSHFKWGTEPTKNVLRHSLISGHSSFMFWMRPNSVGPYLLVTPRKDTKLEFFDSWRPKEGQSQEIYRTYVHSFKEGQTATQKGCEWRQDNTSVLLEPRGAEQSKASYSFKLQWADNYADIRQRLVTEGKISVQIIPGMTLPRPLKAKFCLHTKQNIEELIPEYPQRTSIEYLGEKKKNYHFYEVQFEQLGENYLKIIYNNNKYILLEFFVTEPLETLINKRGQFLAGCQHRDQSKWYDGLISEWNMESNTLLGPDNYDQIEGWRIYAVSCDDPGLSKPSFLAAKNAEYPVQKEVETLDYYIKNFVWGGLQRTEEEEYSYGIYGIPDWQTLRHHEKNGPEGKHHLWRIYDYPHICLLYWSMYRIAQNYPSINTELAPEIYLKRAYRTGLALFMIPQEITGWSAYKTGLYNELVIPEIVRELKKVGWQEKALRLQRHWNKKVRHFVKEKHDLFGSEYPFDSTGFESTHALARSALKNSKNCFNKEDKDENKIYINEAQEFMKKQFRANIFCRGWLETAYYLLGSDYRASGSAHYTLSYMSQMGGWGVLDYALHYSSSPDRHLRLGYASYLSSWALMNTGTPDSNFGYWYPGPQNDGGAGGGFEPAPYGRTWLGQKHSRGSWFYACEIDLGFSGALRTAATVLTRDSLFGLFCYGGQWKKKDNTFKVTLQDGLRRRFFSRLKEASFDLELKGDHISDKQPLEFTTDCERISLVIENKRTENKNVKLLIAGLPEGTYSVFLEDTKTTSFEMVPLQSPERSETEDKDENSQVKPLYYEAKAAEFSTKQVTINLPINDSPVRCDIIKEK